MRVYFVGNLMGWDGNYLDYCGIYSLSFFIINKHILMVANFTQFKTSNRKNKLNWSYLIKFLIDDFLKEKNLI
jgi:hypothetical protein